MRDVMCDVVNYRWTDRETDDTGEREGHGAREGESMTERNV